MAPRAPAVARHLRDPLPDWNNRLPMPLREPLSTTTSGETERNGHPAASRAHEPEVRKRDAVRTRKEILNSARAAFAAKGFEQVGVREITRGAGVNPALINRYFGTKLELFGEAVLTLDPAPQAGRTLLDRLCAVVCARDDARPRDREVFTAVARSAASRETRRDIADFLRLQAIEPIAASLDAADAEVRAGVVVALALGVQILREILGSAALCEADAPIMERLVASALTSITNS